MPGFSLPVWINLVLLLSAPASGHMGNLSNFSNDTDDDVAVDAVMVEPAEPVNASAAAWIQLESQGPS